MLGANGKGERDGSDADRAMLTVKGWQRAWPWRGGVFIAQPSRLLLIPRRLVLIWDPSLDVNSLRSHHPQKMCGSCDRLGSKDPGLKWESQERPK